MVDEEKGTIRVVAWPEVLPWLSIFRTFRLAIGIRALVLAAVAVVLTATVWWGLGQIFSAADGLPHLLPRDAQCPWLSIVGLVDDQPGLPSLPGPEAEPDVMESEGSSAKTGGPCFGVWQQLGRPFLALFRHGVSWTGLVYLLLCGLSSLAIWAFFGGAITRIVAVRLACEERVSLTTALKYACSKWGAYMAAPLFPLIGVLLTVLPILLLGLFLRFGAGVVVAGLLWPLALIGGLLMTILLLGLLFGWPLMWATISVEGTDSFDALSRAYAYVFQRPLHYLFYAVTALFLGLLGWLLVSNFAAAVVALTYWAASWGSGAARIDLTMVGSAELGSVGQAGAMILHFWIGCVKLLAVAFLSSYFWTASTAIYFLLRRDVDATELDEVFLEEDEDQQSYGLPPLETDEQGAPVAADESGEEDDIARQE